MWQDESMRRARKGKVADMMRVPRSSAGLMLCIGMLLPLQLAQGQGVYKWVDEQGVTHYSDSPPANRKSQAVPVPGADSRSGDKPSASPEAWKQKESEFRERQREREAAEARDQAERQRKAALEKGLKQACTDARARLAALQANRRAPMFRRDPISGQLVADYEARGIEIGELSKAIDEKCPRE